MSSESKQIINYVQEEFGTIREEIKEIRRSSIGKDEIIEEQKKQISSLGERMLQLEQMLKEQKEQEKQHQIAK